MFSTCRVHPLGSVVFFLVLGLLRCWFFPGPFLVPTRAGSFHPSSSPCLLRSPVPFASGPPVRPGSWFFPIFLVVFFFLGGGGFVLFLHLWLVGSALSVACGCFILAAFFLGGKHNFFLLGPPSGSLSSLLLLRVLPWSLVSCFGFLPLCLTLGIANFVLPCGYPPACFFGSFPPLPVLVSEFSPMAWSSSVVRFCFLPLFLRPFPAVVAVFFPSGLFGFLPSFLARSLFGALSLSSSSFLVSVLGAFDHSLRLLSFYVVCDLPLFLLVFLFFPLVCVLFSCLLGLLLILFLLLPSFSSFGVSFHIVFLFIGFFSVSNLLFLCFSCILVLVPWLVFLGFRVSLLALFL